MYAIAPLCGAGPMYLPNETTARTVSSRQNVVTRDLLYSSVVLNLYAFVFELFCSRSCLTFHRVKSNKSARHRQNKAQQPFARAVLASTRSAVVCRSQLIVQASGAQELAFHAPTTTRKTPLKHHLPFIRCLNGCSLLFRQCRFCLDITFACIKSANNKGRTHRFAPTAFPRLWFRFPCLVGADRRVCPIKPRTVSSRRNVVTRDLLYSVAVFNYLTKHKGRHAGLPLHICVKKQS